MDKLTDEEKGWFYDVKNNIIDTAIKNNGLSLNDAFTIALDIQHLMSMAGAIKRNAVSSVLEHLGIDELPPTKDDLVCICDGCGKQISEDDAIIVHGCGANVVCEDCFQDGYFACELCGDVHSKQCLIIGKDGKSYCSTCADDYDL